MKTHVLVAIGLLLSSGSVCAGPSATPCSPRFEQGWVRLPASPGSAMTAGFGRFVNGCAAPLEVVAVSSPAFAEVSLHETTQVDGVSRMREVQALGLPAGADVELRPRGLHLMLMQPLQPLREGQRLPVTFGLRDGRELRAELELRRTAP